MEFTFMDLFAGIGGFHQALSSLGGRCLFASEIDSAAAETYENNYGIKVDRDITKVNMEDIPYTDVLAAGFPCQAFSKAGNQKGFDDPTKGTLFFNIKEILEHFETSRPIKFVMLENVRNLTSHDNGNTWRVIKDTLRELNYYVNDEPLVLSPIDFDIPQSRERVFIVAVHKSVASAPIEFNFIKKPRNTDITIFEDGFLDSDVDDKYYLSENRNIVLQMWQEFLDNIEDRPGFPVWSEYFVNSVSEKHPDWKQSIIDKNIKLYKDNKTFINKWRKKYSEYNIIPTNLKFEWQCQNDYDRLDQTIIQFRPSGVRAKRPSYAPALVAIKHVPIIHDGKGYRFLTPKECAKLQSFPETFKISKSDEAAYKQFGNSVNVEVVRRIAEVFLKGLK